MHISNLFTNNTQLISLINYIPCQYSLDLSFLDHLSLLLFLSQRHCNIHRNHKLLQIIFIDILQHSHFFHRSRSQYCYFLLFTQGFGHRMGQRVQTNLFLFFPCQSLVIRRKVLPFPRPQPIGLLMTLLQWPCLL